MYSFERQSPITNTQTKILLFIYLGVVHKLYNALRGSGVQKLLYALIEGTGGRFCQCFIKLSINMQSMQIA